mgnify:CR=1 FL=1
MNIKESELVTKIIKPLQKKLKKGTIICLEGEMGSGKTTFVRYLCQQLEIENSTSPTFNLVNIYEGKIKIYHLDLYRLETTKELYSIDIDQYLSQTDGITLIEWPERLKTLYPKNAIKIHFKYDTEFTRKIRIIYKNN